MRARNDARNKWFSPDEAWKDFIAP
jgi:hypothetical protein